MKTSFIVIFSFISFNLLAHPFTPCDEKTNMADFYPCENIDLLHRVHIDVMGGSDPNNDNGSDIWGWTDDLTGKEYALMTLSYGTAFVDISDPKFPIYLGKLQTESTDSLWRDVKTYQNHAYIVSEALNHGMQVFDLTQLRDVVNPPVEFSATTIYGEISRSHNIVINEDSGFAYVVGARNGAQPCASGLHMIDLSTPASPTFAGCFSSDGYTHDAQCVNYIGPDTDHANKEICFNSNTDTVTIVDVTVKNNPIQISRTGYNNAQYTHQGWLTEDHRYFLMNDELDEQNLGHNTKTYIFDMIDLDSPVLIGFYSGPKASIDHNIYIKGNLAYMSNYTSGLRIVDISDIGNANLVEVASFDSFPANDGATFDGAWSSYPYFESGNIIMSDFQGGLFILEPNICPESETTTGLSVSPNGDNNIDINWSNDLIEGETYNVYRSEGGCAVDNFELIASGIDSPLYTDSTVSGQVNIGYKISKSLNGQCESERSVCVETQTTGKCTAAPEFSGASTVQSSNTNQCGIDVKWNSASSYCGSEVSYDIFKSSDPAFSPDDNNRIASGVNDTQFHDITVENDTEYYYLVRSTDLGNQSQDNNVVKLSDAPQGVLANGTWSNGAEIGDIGFEESSATRHVGWEQSTNRQHSGERSYWSQNSSNTCNDLLSGNIQLSAGENSELSFWTAYDIENRWDGGVVEITTDQQSWEPASLSPDYPGTFRESTNACNYAEDTPAFTGTDLTWKEHTMDLSDYQGQSINIRFNYSTDGAANNEGWYLDDINVTNTQIPSQCIVVEDLIFGQGFEEN